MTAFLICGGVIVALLAIVISISTLIDIWRNDEKERRKLDDFFDAMLGTN